MLIFSRSSAKEHSSQSDMDVPIRIIVLAAVMCWIPLKVEGMSV